MDNSTVKIKQGQLKGSLFKTDNNFEYFGFLGVPYAKPPVGELRFKAPQSPESWEGVRDATVEPSSQNICPQIDMATGTVSGNEDCLYLNVFTPKMTSGQKKLPVLVYIHGGGFIFGDGTLKDEKGPDYLIEQDVVVVSINYRLGIFGFLCLDIPEAQGNMGLKDQVQALKWVKENIASFGGDPANVTVFGISAGAASVDYLLVSPMAKNLFHKAIMQSGAAVNHWARNYKHKQQAKDIAKHLGYIGNYDSTSLYQFLSGRSVEELVKSSFEVVQSVVDQGLYFGLVPTIEKEFENTQAFLTQDSYMLLKSGDFSKIPTIRGFCNFEGLLMHAMKPFLVEKAVESKNMAAYLPFKIDGIEDVNNALRSIYLSKALPDDEIDKFALQFYSDLDFAAGIWASGKVQSEHSVPVYMYKFAYDGSNNYFKMAFGIMRPGTSHGDDIAYTMHVKSIVSQRSETDKKVCYHFARLWTNFAKTGNPNPVENDAAIEWLPFTRNQTNYLVIDERLTLKSNYEPIRMEFFEGMYEKYEGL